MSLFVPKPPACNPKVMGAVRMGVVRLHQAVLQQGLVAADLLDMMATACSSGFFR